MQSVMARISVRVRVSYRVRVRIRVAATKILSKDKTKCEGACLPVGAEVVLNLCVSGRCVCVFVCVCLLGVGERGTFLKRVRVRQVSE